MQNRAGNREYARLKLQQAGDALEEAKGLYAAGAPVSFVMNSIYYAFYYPVLALLDTKGIAPGMQTVSLSLFDREFIATGLIEKRFSDAIRLVFELKPKCSKPAPAVLSSVDLESLLRVSADFSTVVASLTSVEPRSNP